MDDMCKRGERIKGNQLLTRGGTYTVEPAYCTNAKKTASTKVFNGNFSKRWQILDLFNALTTTL